MSQPPERNNATAAASARPLSTKTEEASVESPKALEPEAQRLERLAPRVSPPPLNVDADMAAIPIIEPALAPDKPAAPPLRPKVAPTLQPKATAKPAFQAVKAIAPAAAPKSERVATLDRMSAGFFSQSMTHADDARKALLVAARDRSVAERRACRSDSCVADAFVRQIRATSAIMEGRAEPRN
jgi:hypothetical protein